MWNTAASTISFLHKYIYLATRRTTKSLMKTKMLVLSSAGMKSVWGMLRNKRQAPCYTHIHGHNFSHNEDYRKTLQMMSILKNWTWIFNTKFTRLINYLHGIENECTFFLMNFGGLKFSHLLCSLGLFIFRWPLPITFQPQCLYATTETWSVTFYKTYIRSTDTHSKKKKKKKNPIMNQQEDIFTGM